jgi:hypothetical protein
MFVIGGAMGVAINLDHKPSGDAHEVCDVVANRVLPAELHTQMLGPDARPEPPLDASHVRAEVLRALNHFRSHLTSIKGPAATTNAGC